MTADRADFGGRLRQAREARGMSLAQIAASTKISTMVLEALERNDVSRLPGGLFSRAFVRAYAREIGLDPEHTVEEFIARFADELDGDDSPRRSMATGDTPRTSGSGLRWFGLVLTVALVGLFFGVQRYLARHEGTSGTPAPPSSQAKTSAQAPVPSVATPSPSASPAALPVDQAPVANAQDNARALHVVVTATAPCWVSAKVDGSSAARRTLPTGERVELSAAESIVLTVGDAAALTYTINGAPGRALGTAGHVVTVVINPGNYQSYVQR